MKFKTVAEKLYKAFIKAGFNVGPLRDVTSNYLPAFRFSVEKRTNDTVNLSRYNGKNFVHVECDVEDSFKIDQILNDFKPEVHFVIYF